MPPKGKAPKGGGKSSPKNEKGKKPGKPTDEELFGEDDDEEEEKEQKASSKAAKAPKAEVTSGPLPNINGTSKLLGRLYGDLDKEAELDAEERGMFDAAMKTTETQDLIAYHIRCKAELEEQIEVLNIKKKELAGEASTHEAKAEALAKGLPVDQDLFDWQNQFTRFHSEKALLLKNNPKAHDVLFESGGKQEIAFRDLSIPEAEAALKFFADHVALSKIPPTRKEAVAKRLEGLKELEIASRRPAPSDKPKGSAPDLRADQPAKNGAQVLDASKPPQNGTGTGKGSLFPDSKPAAAVGH